MSPPEKSPELTGSAAPRAPLTDFEVAVMLHKIKWELSAINGKLEKAEQNDERFKAMEHDVRIAKWAALIVGAAALTAITVAFVGRFSVRFSDPPAPPSSAERLGSDRVPPPTSAPLQGH